jgi:hypothetical protein
MAVVTTLINETAASAHCAAALIWKGACRQNCHTCPKGITSATPLTEHSKNG